MFKIFKDHRNLIWSISKVLDGNMDFRFGKEEDVALNRKKFLSGLNIPLDRCAGINLKQESDILETRSGDVSFCATEEREGDALITNERNIFIFMKVADCLPVILFDPLKNNLALVHCGWKSTDKKIVQKAVKRMAEKYESNPENILAAIGPGIHKESYWSRNPVQAASPDWKPFINKISDKRAEIDLVGYNLFQLKEAGIMEKNIEISAVDTGKDRDYFSHFRSNLNGEPEGRFCVVAGIKRKK